MFAFAACTFRQLLCRKPKHRRVGRCKLNQRLCQPFLIFLVLRSLSPLLYLTPSGTALVIPPEATCHPRECQDHTSMHRRPPSSTMMVAVLVAACASGEQVNCSDRRAPIWLQFVHRRRGDSRSSACTIILYVCILRAPGVRLYVYFTRRRGAHTAHTQVGRPTHEAPTREYTHKHTQTHNPRYTTG